MGHVLLLYEKPRIRDIIISAGTLCCGHGGKVPSSGDHHAAFVVSIYAAADQGGSAMIVQKELPEGLPAVI